MDEAEIKALQDRFDARYKQKDDCNRDMDAVRASDTEILTKLGIIQHTLDGYKWTFRTAGGAAIVALVGAVLALIIK